MPLSRRLPNGSAVKKHLKKILTGHILLVNLRHQTDLLAV